MNYQVIFHETMDEFKAGRCDSTFGHDSEKSAYAHAFEIATVNPGSVATVDGPDGKQSITAVSNI